MYTKNVYSYNSVNTFGTDTENIGLNHGTQHSNQMNHKKAEIDTHEQLSNTCPCRPERDPWLRPVIQWVVESCLP